MATANTRACLRAQGPRVPKRSGGARGSARGERAPSPPLFHIGLPDGRCGGRRAKKGQGQGGRALWEVSRWHFVRGGAPYGRSHAGTLCERAHLMGGLTLALCASVKKHQSFHPRRAYHALPWRKKAPKLSPTSSVSRSPLSLFFKKSSFSFVYFFLYSFNIHGY
jgi:hypothetical protein